MERTFLAGKQPERGAGWRRGRASCFCKGRGVVGQLGCGGDPGRHVSLLRAGRRRVFTLVLCCGPQRQCVGVKGPGAGGAGRAGWPPHCAPPSLPPEWQACRLCCVYRPRESKTVFPSSLVAGCATHQWDVSGGVLKREDARSHLPAHWNAYVVAGAQAAIVDHEGLCSEGGQQ